MLMHFSCGSHTKTLKLLICLLWCQAVETVTEFANLGQNVSINCNLNEKEIHWILIKPPNPPVMIIRIFSASSIFYTDINLRSKYSVRHKHSLFISNVTSEELGVYYCMTTKAPPKFSNGTRLKIKDQTELPECQNHTVMMCLENNHTVVNYIEQTIQAPWINIILISGLMHGVLIIAIIGYVCCYCGKNEKHEEPVLIGESNTVYTEVVLSLVREKFEQNQCFSAAAQNTIRKPSSSPSRIPLH